MAKGAQRVIAQETPIIATSVVATATLRASRVENMHVAKIR